MSETSNNNFNPDMHISHVIAPEKPTSIGGTPKEQEATPNRRWWSPRKAVAAGGLVLTLVAGGAVGAALSNSGEKTPEATSTSDPEDSNEIIDEQPTLWYEKINVDPTADEIRIDAATVTPDQIPALFYNERMPSWYNSGYSLDFAEGVKSSNDFNAEATAVAAEYDELFDDNMVASNLNPGAINVVETIKANHDDIITIGALTSFPEMSRLDKVPYMRATELVSYKDLTVAEDGSVEFTATVREYDNADENSANERPNVSGNFIGSTITQTVEFVVEDGAYKLSSIDSVN